MSERWKVNEGTQVWFKDKVHVGGESFSASPEEVEAEGLAQYVSKVRQQAAPKAENKAQAQPEPRKSEPVKVTQTDQPSKVVAKAPEGK